MRNVLSKLFFVMVSLVCVLALSACDLLGGTVGPDSTAENTAHPPALNLPDTESPFHLGDIVQDDDGGYALDFGTYPLMDGYETCAPLARAFARFHLKLSDEDLSGFVDFTTDYMLYFTHNEQGSHPYLREQGIPMKDKQADILLAPAPSEADYAMARENGSGLLAEPIAMDAVVLFVPQSNPVDSLTQDEIRGIYTGEITNWKELGGDDIAIVAYQDGDHAGRDVIYAQVMRGEQFADGPVDEIEIPSGIPGGDSYTVEYFAEYDNTGGAIGYGSLIMIKDTEGIKILAVDGVYPDPGALKDASYPLVITYNAIVRDSDRDGVNGDFLEWILSDEGRRCVEDAGYVPPVK